MVRRPDEKFSRACGPLVGAKRYSVDKNLQLEETPLVELRKAVLLFSDHHIEDLEFGRAQYALQSIVGPAGRTV